MPFDDVPAEPFVEEPPRPRRFFLGVAEYTHTEGLADYELRGALADYGTFRSQLRDNEYIRYRARSGHTEEAGYGRFHWKANTVTRIRALSGSLISWGPGRRLIFKIDDYWTPPVGELVEELPSPTIVGIGEYTHTEGTGPYELRGPIREWMSLALALHHNQRVLYRCHNSAKEEFGEGIYDAANNTLIRGLTGISSDIVNWAPGRKLIEILEKY